MSDLPEKTLLRPDEAAAFFRVSLRTLYRWIDQGRLPAYRPATGCTRIKRSDAVRLLEESKKE